MIPFSEAERIAQEIGFDSAWVTIVAPTGKETRLQFLDAYMGFLRLADRHVFTNDLRDQGFTCKDVSLDKEFKP